jgi:outer membrane protein TolC
LSTLGAGLCNLRGIIMRIVGLLCATAIAVGSAQAQQQPKQTPPPSGTRDPRGSLGQDSLRLTRSDAVRLALARNPQLEVVREQSTQARARRVQAVAIPDPAFSASRDDQSRLLGPAGARNVGVGLTIPFPDKFRLRNSVASADVRSADFQYTLFRQQVAAQTARSYDSLLVTRRHRRDLTEGRTLADEFLRKAQARFEAGTVARLDVIRARVDLAQADNALIANERDIVNAEAALNHLLGQPLGTALITADSLGVPLPIPEFDLLESLALKQRPELSDVQSQQRGARAATSLAREYWLPDFFVSANRDYAQPEGVLYSTGVAFPFPLFFWQHSSGEIAESRSRERELAATYRDTRLAVGQDVRQAYATAVTALRQVIYIRDELLPAATEAFRVASVG